MEWTLSLTKVAMFVLCLWCAFTLPWLRLQLHDRQVPCTPLQSKLAQVKHWNGPIERLVPLEQNGKISLVPVDMKKREVVPAIVNKNDIVTKREMVPSAVDKKDDTTKKPAPKEKPKFVRVVRRVRKVKGKPNEILKVVKIPTDEKKKEEIEKEDITMKKVEAKKEYPIPKIAGEKKEQKSKASTVPEPVEQKTKTPTVSKPTKNKKQASFIPKPSPGEFRKIPGSDIHIYSAIQDNRDIWAFSANATIVFTIAPKDSKEKLYCHLSTTCQPQKPQTVIAKLKYIKIFITPTKWFGSFLICPQPKDQCQVDRVKISTSKDPTLKDKQITLNVSPAIIPDSQPQANLGVCLGSIFHYEDKYLDYLVEWFEFQKIMGISKVFIYGVFNAGEKVQQVLAHYVTEGILTIVPWKFPKGVEVPYYGQKLALNECVYRNMKNFKYIGIFDLDEFLVPTDNRPNLAALADSVFLNSNKVVTSIRFAQKQICNVAQLNETLKTKNNQKLMSLYKNAFLEYHRRSGKKGIKNPKSIINPRRIAVAGVHSPEEVVIRAGVNHRERAPNAKDVTWKEARDGALLHYRRVWPPCSLGDTERIHIMDKYIDILAARVETTKDILGIV